jgi:hypothetical protein
MPGTIPPDAMSSADAHEDIRPMRISHLLPEGGRNSSQFRYSTAATHPPEAFDG